MNLDEASESLRKYADGDAGRIARAVGVVLAELDCRGAAIERVRKLHSPDRYGDCPACGLSSDENAMPWSECATIAALDGQ